MSDKTLRRIRLDQNVPAELAIRAAMRAVEAMPADLRLTQAVMLLDQAREKVADFVDWRRHVLSEGMAQLQARWPEEFDSWLRAESRGGPTPSREQPPNE